MPADQPADVPADTPTDDGGVVVDVAPQLVNAFSQDGEDVVVRFSEEIDSTTGGDPSNYEVLGSNSSTLPCDSPASTSRGIPP